MGRIRAVTFDFWDTLFPSLGRDGGRTPADYRVEILKDFLAARGRRFPVRTLREAHDRAEDRLFEHWRTDLRYSGADTAVKDMADHLGIVLGRPDAEQLAELFQMTSQVPRIVPFDGVPGLLAQMAQEYRLGIVSDVWLTPGAVLRHILRGLGLLGHFEATAFSDETRYLKPHQRQFGAAVRAMGAERAETVHIGDSERRDVAGAADFGLRTVLLAWGGKADATRADRVITDIRQAHDAVRAFED
ncbi:MAG: HAD family hydrolase [candidate division WOR-3 bacterium]|nr:MAG: HAD family hydrolase [candidate division WOR-3 bacterium]